MAEGERRDEEQSGDGDDERDATDLDFSGDDSGDDGDDGESKRDATDLDFSGDGGDDGGDDESERDATDLDFSDVDSGDEGDEKSREESSERDDSDDDSGDEESEDKSDDRDDSDDDSSDEESDDDSDEEKGKRRQQREMEQEGEAEGKAESEPERDEDERERDEEEEEDKGPGIPAFIGLALATVIFTLIGLWIFSRVIAPGYASALVLGVFWFVLAALLLMRFLRNRGHLRPPVLGVFLLTVAVIVVLVAIAGIGSTTAREQVVTDVVKASDAQPTASVPERANKPLPKQNVEFQRGDFKAVKEGSASGHAAIVRLKSGALKLVITDLDVAPGPDQRVRLAIGDGGDIKHALDLGPLRGNKGNLQYSLPSGTDVKALHTVVIYCRLFSFAYARAQMKAQ